MTRHTPPLAPPPWFGKGSLSRFLLLYVVLAGLLTMAPSLVMFEVYRPNEFRGLALVIGLAMTGLVMVMVIMLPLVYRLASGRRRHVVALLLSLERRHCAEPSRGVSSTAICTARYSQ